MTTFEYIDADGRAVLLVASSPENAARAAARFEVDRTGSVALAYRAAGTIEEKADAAPLTGYPGSPAIGRPLVAKGEPCARPS